MALGEGGAPPYYSTFASRPPLPSHHACAIIFVSLPNPFRSFFYASDLAHAHAPTPTQPTRPEDGSAVVREMGGMLMRAPHRTAPRRAGHPGGRVKWLIDTTTTTCFRNIKRQFRSRQAGLGLGRDTRGLSTVWSLKPTALIHLFVAYFRPLSQLGESKVSVCANRRTVSPCSVL